MAKGKSMRPKMSKMPKAFGAPAPKPMGKPTKGKAVGMPHPKGKSNSK